MDDLADDARARRANAVEALEPAGADRADDDRQHRDDRRDDRRGCLDRGRRAPGDETDKPAETVDDGKRQGADRRDRDQGRQGDQAKRGERVAPVTQQETHVPPLANPADWVKRCAAAAAKATTLDELKESRDR
jgi:hypothetical protein